MMADIEKQRQASNQNDNAQNQSSDKSSGQQGNSGQGTTGQTNNSNGNGALPKPPAGKGSVPKNQRDDKRLYTKADKTKKLNGPQNRKCVQCGEDLKPDDAIGHHVQRHADGGKTDDANLGVVCVACHDKLHEK
jgi:hypothetical protein